MGYLKGSDGIPKTIKNPLEGSIGNIDLNRISANTVSASGNIASGNLNVNANVVTGNILTDGYYYANGVAFTGGAGNYGNANVAAYLPTYTGNLAGSNISVTSNASVTGNISGNVLFTPAVSADWANAAAIYNVALALNALANALANFETGTGFTFAGPFSNDSTAAAGGVAIGQVYFNNSGGLVVRQT